jgi:beta-lactamase class D
MHPDLPAHRPQLGLATYRRAVRAMAYGNRRIRSSLLDSFWLKGPFTISAQEQVALLERLRRGALPISRRAIREVREMMVIERNGRTVVRGKTGYVFTTTPDVGWWVGWVARHRQTWTFALNLDITDAKHGGARTAIGRAILRDLGAPL